MDINVQGLILKSILQDPEEGLNIWPKLKSVYFDSSYSSVYSRIRKHYDEHMNLPSFTDFEISLRDTATKANIIALQRLEVPDDIDIDIAVEALIDEYTQNEALKKLDTFLDTITLQSSDEIKQEINDIALYLEEKTHTSEEVFYMSDISLIDEEEINSRVPLGLNNTFDANSGGIALTELVMVGGLRGSGKSVVATNIIANQYLNGDIGLVFSIEMRARECFNRTISVLSEVEYSKIRNNRLDNFDLRRIAEVRANMFENNEQILEDYIKHGDYQKFEDTLIRNCQLNKENQLIIVDNQGLTLADIDMHINKFKSMFGDKLKVVVVDYVNQISIENMYDWMTQINLSKKLKDFARKYNVAMVTPYQIDKSGEARFSKGILDAADMAIVLTNQDDYLEFTSTKVRNMAPFTFNAPIEWSTLKIDHNDYVPNTLDESDDLPA